MDHLLATLLISFLLGVPCGYVTKVLLLEEKDSHEGPFKRTDIFVYFEGSKHAQAVALFDYIRYIFGVYDTKKIQNAWVVKPINAEVWSCPYCLSMWVAFIFSLPFSLLYEVPFVIFISVHLMIVGISVGINRTIYD